MLADENADWSAIGLSHDRVREVFETELALFASRTTGSAKLLGQAQKRMPRGVPMGWMADLYPHPPVFVESGSGASFRDVDGNEYLDFNLSDLSTAVGFAPPGLKEAVGAQAERGVQFLLPTEDAEVVAGKLEDRFGMAYWQFTLSASWRIPKHSVLPDWRPAKTARLSLVAAITVISTRL